MKVIYLTMAGRNHELPWMELKLKECRGYLCYAWIDHVVEKLHF